MKSSVPSLLIACLVMSLNSYTQQVLYCPPTPAPENVTEFVCNSPSLHEFPTGFPARAKMISVEFTQVSSLGVEALQGLPNLQELHLSNNRLKTLPSGLFRNLPQLHTLDLSTNHLEDLPPEIFTNASSLILLPLSENQLAELHPSWFQTLGELRILGLDHNQVKEIPISCFDKLKKLTSLDLSFNLLRRLAPEMFSGLDNLEKLILESNPIQCIVGRTFHWHPKLTVLSLKNSSLTNIMGFFQPLEQLELLDLSDNELTTMEPPVYKTSANLSLDLSGNPWACDCRLDNLLTWVNEHNIHLYSKEEIVCASPKHFKGECATSLHKSQICPC
uniref:Phospholipase A2 inhibitor n=1 Tax=Gloydius brevicaudus siniticus TaxID=31147 RepID=PLIB_GLOBS|nr:RecName: Full=Phospholipase A2 inhibitor; Short=beta-PLI; Flags: Precursor [Gloydius brevicaudus siniticus]BAA31994.1 phospholipase A2 inhibitor [Gloydius brevicaudus siniticus]